MAYEEILYEVEDGVATLTLNRPEKLNAWTPVMAREVRDAMAEAGTDDDVRVIILTGAGRGFCAGADMGNLDNLATGGLPENVLSCTEGMNEEERRNGGAGRFSGSDRPGFRHQYAYFPSVPRPIIAAINGPCAGLGVVLSLFCDIRFAAEGAKFTTSFSRRGLIAEHGISWALPRVVGLANACDLLFSARKFEAAEAHAMGLVNRVIPHENLLDEARAYARDLATLSSPRSMRIMKRQLWESMFQNLDEALQIANSEMLVALEGDDFKEGVAHFVEKRAPVFTGR